MNEEFTESLRNAKTVEEFMNIINDADEKEASIDERLAGADEESTAEETTGKVKILAVTSCPTGIAHTYMAAEGIEKAAKAKECAVKVETRGSGGAKNVLTAKEIEEADGIIVAADAQVPLDRFDGKKVIICQVSDGISKADELVDRVINGDVPVISCGKRSRSKGKQQRQIKWNRTSDLYTAYEWCITYASVRSRWRYPDRTCIPD